MTEGTAATITEKTQKVTAERMYIVRRPKASEMGEHTIPPIVCPNRYLKVSSISRVLPTWESFSRSYIVTKAKYANVLLIPYSVRAESAAAV